MTAIGQSLPGGFDLWSIAAEIALAVLIVLLLVWRCATASASRLVGPLVLLATIGVTALCGVQLLESVGAIEPVVSAERQSGTAAENAAAAAASMLPSPSPRAPLFDGLLVRTPLATLFRLLVTVSLGLTVALCLLTGVPNTARAVDFWTLMLGSTVGMLLTVSASSVLMMFIGIEMMSVPGYALTAYFKGRADATESSLKYVVYGAGASGILLYGLSVLVGLTGQTELQPLFAEAATLLGEASATGGPEGILSLVGLLMVTVGLAFKLSAVPFHFWCPDVFTGAPAEVAGFLSVASKLATLGLALRLAAESVGDTALVFGTAFAAYSIASVIYGNLVAYSQENAKRLMAYSTIAHAGYLSLGIAAVSLLPPSRRPDAVAAAVYYAFAYLLMNLIVFGGIAVLRNATGGTTLAAFASLTRRTPRATAVIGAIAASCFSLVGLPPFAGFFGKLLVFASAFESARERPLMAVALAASMLMSIVSLGYYLKLLAPMVFGESDATRRRVDVTLPQAVYLTALAVALFAMLIPFAAPFLELSQQIGATAVPSDVR